MRKRLWFRIIIFILAIILGWVFISYAADSYVEYFIRSKRGFYTSTRYLDWLWVNVTGTLLLMLFLFSLGQWLKFRSFVWLVILGIIYVSVLSVIVQDEAGCGRPYGPEIAFGTLIFLFHILLMYLLRGLNLIK